MLEFDDINATKVLENTEVETVDGYVTADSMFALLIEFAKNKAIVSSRDPNTYYPRSEEEEIESFIQGCRKKSIGWWSSIARLFCICMDFLATKGIANKFIIHESEKPLFGEEYDLRTFLKINYNNDITIKGHFYLQYPLSNEDRKSSTKVTIEGTFYLHNSTKSMDINIPPTLKVPPFELRPYRNSDPVIHYNSAAEYNQRESRITRLSENKKKRDAMKEALSNGLISLADSYGMPLEIGCTVAFYANGRVKVGKVTGQTTVKVTCKEQNSKWSNNCYPFEVARIL